MNLILSCLFCFLNPADSHPDRREIGFISKLFLVVLQQNSLKTQTHENTIQLTWLSGTNSHSLVILISISPDSLVQSHKGLLKQSPPPSCCHGNLSSTPAGCSAKLQTERIPNPSSSSASDRRNTSGTSKESVNVSIF